MIDSPTQAQAANDPDLQVPMADVVRFVRQLSHDLRNHLNAVELQSAFIAEIAEGAELKAEVKRLRGMMSQLATALQKLSATVADLRLNEMQYEALAFVEDLRAKVSTEFPDQSASIHWQTTNLSGVINVDPQLLQEAMLELFRNALQHSRGEGEIIVRADSDGAHFRMELEEPKKEFAAQPGSWGREPFRHVQHGRYGLGLHRVCRVVGAHGGKFKATYDPSRSALITSVVLPKVPPSQ